MKMTNGTPVEVSFGLDDMSPERFESIMPVLREHIKEYHKLREYQRETES